MQPVCSHCGEAMIQGRVASSGVMIEGEMPLSFVVSTGNPTSLNPIKAVLQGMHHEPTYREEVCPIRGQVCPKCGRFEFFLAPEDLTKVTGLVGPTATE